MTDYRRLLLTSAAPFALAFNAHAAGFDIPGGDLTAALNAYSAQSGVHLMVSTDVVRGLKTSGVKGDLSPEKALAKILSGTGLTTSQDIGGGVAIVRAQHSSDVRNTLPQLRLAQASPTPRASVETVTVTSSKLGGADVQSIPIAITALSQEQLTSTQTAGGPDLVKQVPNLTFTKTNFTGYSIQVRGIGTQAISVTTDPAVAVAFNDTPFIRNHFFEQEFYDLAQVEVLRGPQGTLYGRNATAGVVNITSAKPTDQFGGMASADIGNYKNRRFEGMLNIPFVSDKLDLRVAGEWTKRDGYSFNETTDQQIDGRDLWSSRITLGWKPVSTVQAYLVWEHFSENDDRLRSGKQLCKTDYGPGATSVFSDGKLTAADGTVVTVPGASGAVFGLSAADFSQGCLPSSLYASDSFQVPNGFSLPFISGASFLGIVSGAVDPYSQTKQSTNLRNIQSAIEPKYIAKNDTVEFNASWNVSPMLTLYSDTGYNRDFLWSTEDYNRFDTSPGIFVPGASHGAVDANGVFCDPQLGCSDRLVVQDLAEEHAWQFSQELRLTSSFKGPLNFSVGGNYLHYETEENYYVFSNTFTMISLDNTCGSSNPTVANSIQCLSNGKSYQLTFPNVDSIPTESPQYIDPNPITSLDNAGHNYFVSQNPYLLDSYAGFGEAYYSVTPELKLTAGVRWTDDRKHFVEIPSELLVIGYGYPSLGALDQEWLEWTGRFVANWSPKIDFTDQSMFYASYSRGYKAGGANPPGPVLLNADVFNASSNVSFPVHPFDFKPEFVNAFELGTKNAMLDGALTFNGDVFYYDYKGYQISQIVDRSSINLNFDATVKGAEIEATYEPLPGLKFSFAGGYEDTRINDNQYAIDLMDRTAGTPGWIVIKPSVGQSSNCIIPEYVAAALIQVWGSGGGQGSPSGYVCGSAYNSHVDPLTGLDYVAETGNGTHAPVGHASGGGFIYNSPSGYPGYDPNSVDPNLNPALLSAVNNGLGLPPNNGEGFAKNVGGNELPNAPHFTVSVGADYTIPVSPDWAATLHSDFYWQDNSWARVFNDDPYDRIHGYTNVNLALILTDATGWQFMGYVKNVFDTTAITGDFLNSDDSGLTTNIFLTDPRLFGVRVTKRFDAGGTGGETGLEFLDSGEKPQLWLTVGGSYNILTERDIPWSPANAPAFPNGLLSPEQLQDSPRSSFDTEGELTFQPADSDWKLTAGIRYGRSSRNKSLHKSLPQQTKSSLQTFFGSSLPCVYFGPACSVANYARFEDSHSGSNETHTILDFTLGRDVGLGSVTGTLSAGVRMAQFTGEGDLSLNAVPVTNFNPDFTQKYHEVYQFDLQARRSFHGIGPELSWKSSQPLFGEAETGEVSFDWGVNAGVLFGRQKVQFVHSTSECLHINPLNGNLNPCISTSTQSTPGNRSRSVTVPNLGGFVGASANYRTAKISMGYRADFFFGAADVGVDTPKSRTVGFHGPFATVSLGL
jgi:outer membrane receptor protein involved in Fe transport